MRIMRKLVVLTIIGLSALVVLDNAQANEQIQSEKFAAELTESLSIAAATMIES